MGFKCLEESKKMTKKCPVCGSNEIVLDLAGHSGKYLCKKCRYSGVLVIEE